MRMNGRRQSGNVDDRRRLGTGGKAGIGGGIVGIIAIVDRKSTRLNSRHWS